MFEAMTDTDLIGELAMTDRGITAAQGYQLRLLAELHHRSAGWIAPTLAVELDLDPVTVTAAEVAPVLAVSPRTAADRVWFAADATRRLPAAVAAVAAGRLPLTNLRILAEHTQPLSDPAAAVAEVALAQDDRLTPSMFGRVVARAVLRADPAAADTRHRTARSGRRVEVYPAEDGMAVLRALRMYQALTTAAVAERDADRAAGVADPRSLDARRADLLADALLDPAVWAVTTLIPLDDAPTDPAATHPAATDTHPATDDPGPPGDLAAVAVGAAPGVHTDANDREATPRPAEPAPRADRDDPGASVDPGASADTVQSASADAAAPNDPGADVGSSTRPAPDRRLDPRYRRPRWDRAATQVHVVVPAAVLGPTRPAEAPESAEAPEPAELTGYGPITDVQARALAADGVWRRILTDPTSGVVTDLGRTTYRPPEALADLVRTRDGTCRFPACSRRARLDLDHTWKYPHGPTAEHNLGDLCRQHHLIKTFTRWRVEQYPHGVLVWTSPTGHRYLTHPTGGLRHPRPDDDLHPADRDPGPPPDPDYDPGILEPVA